MAERKDAYMKEYLPYIIIGAAILLVILVLVANSLLRQHKLKKLGIEGEKKVARVLRKFAGIRSFKVLNDVYLPLYDKTTQVDHILVGFFGLLVIETKNLAGEVYGDPKKKEWLHIVGKERHKLYNPLMQNQAHIDCIRHILGKANIYNVQIESLVVFTRNKTELYLPKGLPIIKIKQLRKFLKQERFAKDNNLDVEKVVQVLNDTRITDKKQIAEHNKNVKIMAKNNK